MPSGRSMDSRSAHGPAAHCLRYNIMGTIYAERSLGQHGEASQAPSQYGTMASPQLLTFASPPPRPKCPAHGAGMTS